MPVRVIILCRSILHLHFGYTYFITNVFFSSHCKALLMAPALERFLASFMWQKFWWKTSSHALQNYLHFSKKVTLVFQVKSQLILSLVNLQSFTDEMCSGKASCQYHVTEIMRTNIQPCPLELSSYLAASYQCIPSNEILSFNVRSMFCKALQITCAQERFPANSTLPKSGWKIYNRARQSYLLILKGATLVFQVNLHSRTFCN